MGSWGGVAQQAMVSAFTAAAVHEGAKAGEYAAQGLEAQVLKAGRRYKWREFLLQKCGGGAGVCAKWLMNRSRDATDPLVKELAKERLWILERTERRFTPGAKVKGPQGQGRAPTMLMEGLMETLQVFQALSRKIKGVGDPDEEADAVFRVNYGGLTKWKVWEKTQDRQTPYAGTSVKVAPPVGGKAGGQLQGQGFGCPNCAATGKRGVMHSMGECRAAGNKCRVPCTMKKADGKQCGGLHWFAECPAKPRLGKMR